jgi:hypothetical protein
MQENTDVLRLVVMAGCYRFYAVDLMLMLAHFIKGFNEAAAMPRPG